MEFKMIWLLCIAVFACAEWHTENMDVIAYHFVALHIEIEIGFIAYNMVSSLEYQHIYSNIVVTISIGRLEIMWVLLF